jgi:hypothetical protein
METTWVTVSPGGHYAEACQRFGFAKYGQHLVVGFTAWNDWYNRQRFSRIWIKPPLPAFCGENWAAAKSVADEMNNWKE